MYIQNATLNYLKDFNSKSNKTNSSTALYNETYKANSKKQSDAIEISADAYDLNEKNDNIFASSGTDDLCITRKDENTFTIYFDNIALAHRAVDRGYINVNGRKIELTDDVKEKILKTSREAFEANERATLEYAARHNMIVAKQQAEAYADEGKRMSRAMDIMSRLASGEKVSQEDLKFLKEYNPEMYVMAMRLAAMAERNERQEKKHIEERHKDNNTKNFSEDYTKELDELKKSFTETTLDISFENGVSFGLVSTETCEYK